MRLDKKQNPDVVFDQGKKLASKKEGQAAAATSRRAKPSSEVPAFVALQAQKEETVVRDILRDARRANAPVAEICFGEVSVRIWRGADKETVSAVLDALKEYYTC